MPCFLSESRVFIIISLLDGKLAGLLDFVNLDLRMKPNTRYGRQRELMRELCAKHDGDQVSACGEYASAARNGLVPHKSNRNKVPPEKYAISLWYDGVKRGWLNAAGSGNLSGRTI